MKVTLKARKITSIAKDEALRALVDKRWTYDDLLSIFGAALGAKFQETPTRHMVLGKHTRSRRGNVQHPAGTKLVRGFIRHSGKESTYWRELYAFNTGEQYGKV